MPAAAATAIPPPVTAPPSRATCATATSAPSRRGATTASTASMAGRIRIGVDVGGTFTDFVLVDEARDLIFTGKRLTTPADPSIAITEGIARLLRESGTAIEALDSIVHGTTLVA